MIAVIQSLSPVSTTLQCLNTTTNDVTIEQSIFGVLDVTPNHGAEIIHTMCLEAGVVYEVTFTFLNFGSGTPRLLLDSVRCAIFLIILYYYVCFLDCTDTCIYYRE